MDELKLSEEKIRKELTTEMIIDELYCGLRINSKGKISFDCYNISSKNILYLLEKYDKNRYDAYKEMLVKGRNENY